MFGDIGWAEMMVIGIVALVVIGPEDLPHMFRQLGRFTAKIRAMGRDFSRAMEQAAAETGVKDMAKDLKAATSVGGLGLDKVKAAADKFEKWDPIKPKTDAAKPLVPAPMPAATKPAARVQAQAEPQGDAVLGDKIAPKAAKPKAAKPKAAPKAAPAKGDEA